MTGTASRWRARMDLRFGHTRKPALGRIQNPSRSREFDQRDTRARTSWAGFASGITDVCRHPSLKSWTWAEFGEGDLRRGVGNGARRNGVLLPAVEYHAEPLCLPWFIITLGQADGSNVRGSLNNRRLPSLKRGCSFVPNREGLRRFS